MEDPAMGEGPDRQGLNKPYHHNPVIHLLEEFRPAGPRPFFSVNSTGTHKKD